MPGGLSMFGYHVHGSAGRIFFGGLLVGAVGMLGIIMVADGLRRNASLRRELMRFRRDAGANQRAAASGDAAETTTAPKPPSKAPAERTGPLRSLRDRWPVRPGSR